VGAYYYLRIIVVMYMNDAKDESPVAAVPLSLTAALAACVAATIYLGVLPGEVLGYTQRSAIALVQGSSSAAELKAESPVPVQRP
jgi:NADH:ubiquinone oxidoreductase subunit 2 (subunit N)